LSPSQRARGRLVHSIEQHPSLQSAQVGKLEPIAHLLGKLASDPELTFGFVPSTSVCGDETGASLQQPAVVAEPRHHHKRAVSLARDLQPTEPMW
jgi:hypothetical protein